MDKEFEAKRKTPLEMFKEIETLEVADSPKMTVEDCLPFMCEKVEQALTELKTIKESNPSEAFISGESISISVDEKNRVFRSTKNYTLKEALEILNPSNRLPRACEKRQAFYIIKKEIEKRQNK